MQKLIIGAVAVGLAAVLALPAMAQDQGNQANQGGQAGQPGQGGFGGRRGRLGGAGGGFSQGPGGQGGYGRQRGFGGRGMFGAGPGAMSDHNPMVSHVLELIQRRDVQAELQLSISEKNALNQFESEAQQAMQQQMQQIFQNMRAQGGFGGFRQRGQGGQPGQPGAAGGQDTAGAGQPGLPAGQQQQFDPQAMRQQMEQMRTQIQAQRAQAQEKVESGLAEILRPDQMTRLRQLDLQWRSALALADTKVADRVQLSQPHRAVVAGLLGEYQTALSESRQQVFQAMRPAFQRGGGVGVLPGPGGPNSAGPGGLNTAGAGPAGQPGQPGQPGQLAGQGGPRSQIAMDTQNPMLAMQKAESAARKEEEGKILAQLTVDEKANWKAAIGKPFTFMTDDLKPEP